MELMTAIVFIKDKDYPIKYRKITNINRFVTFVQSKYPFATAINFYKKETKEFLKQIKI
jgi:hypothetical protein